MKNKLFLLRRPGVQERSAIHQPDAPNPAHAGRNQRRLLRPHHHHHPLPGHHHARPEQGPEGRRADRRPNGKAIMAVYKAMIEQAAALHQHAAPRNNATFQVLNPFNWREDIDRMDYRAERQAQHLLPLASRQLRSGGSVRHVQRVGSCRTRRRRAIAPATARSWASLDRQPAASSTKRRSTRPGTASALRSQGDDWERNTYGFQFPRIFGGNGLYGDGHSRRHGEQLRQLQRSGARLPDVARPPTSRSPTPSTLHPGRDTPLTGGIAIIRNRKDQNGRTNYDGTSLSTPAPTPTPPATRSPMS